MPIINDLDDTKKAQRGKENSKSHQPGVTKAGTVLVAFFYLLPLWCPGQGRTGQASAIR